MDRMFRINPKFLLPFILLLSCILSILLIK